MSSRPQFAGRVVPVSLTLAESRVVANVGLERELTNRFLQRPTTYGNEGEDNWTGHVEAAASEYVVAKIAEVPWINQNVRNLRNAKGEKIPDLLTFIEVRWRSREDWDLLAHPEDPDDRALVLVTGRIPKFTIRGWMWARDAKNRERFWDDPSKRAGKKSRPAFFVPQRVLRPFDELLRLLHAPKSGVRSRCYTHGEYDGDGNCPGCYRMGEFEL
jgi:hypothetical protein